MFQFDQLVHALVRTRSPLRRNKPRRSRELLAQLFRKKFTSSSPVVHNRIVGPQWSPSMQNPPPCGSVDEVLRVGGAVGPGLAERDEFTGVVRRAGHEGAGTGHR